MAVKEVYFATSSSSRLAAAKQIFWKKGIIVKPLPKTYTETQGKTGKEIAQATARQAAREYRLPVMREYKSLFLEALGGFPGPYLHHFHKEISAEKLLDIMKNHQEKKGLFVIDTVLSFPEGELIEANTNIGIKIAGKLKGNTGNWEKVLIRQESDKTFAEERDKESEEFKEIFSKNLKEIAEKLLTK